MKKLIFCLILILLLVSCNDNSSDNSKTANPASQKCIDDGYKIYIRENENGDQTGYCILSDEVECEEWDYFRGNCV